MASTQWGDVDDTEDFVPVTETSVDDKGVKTTIETVADPDNPGARIRYVRKFKTVVRTRRLSQAAAKRAQWKPFGQQVLRPFDAQSVTSTDEFRINDPNDNGAGEAKQQEDALLLFQKKSAARALEREALGNLGLDADSDLSAARNTSGKGGHYNPALASRVAGGGLGGGEGKYVPPGARGGGSYQASDDSLFTLRVTNISEDATEADLHELFKPFGAPYRVYLAKDRETNRSRGFAFVSYTRLEPAQAALEKLNGYGYDHLILRVEFSENRERNNDVANENILARGRFVTGYGGALPQGRG